MPGSPRAPPSNNFIPLIQRGRGIRPDEAPATLQPALVTRTWRGSRLGKVPNPSHGEMRREEDEEKGPRLHGCADCRNPRELHRRHRRPRPRRRAELPGVRPPGPARTRLRLRRVFRPLEIAYDFSAYDTEELRKRIEAGPANIWRYAPCCPSPPTSRPSRTSTPAGPSSSRPTTSPASWASPAVCTSRTTPATPRTPSRTASSPRPSRPPAPSASPPCPAPPPATSPVPSVPPPPGPASAPACSSRTTWSRARSSWPPSTAASWSASRATTTT